MYILNTNITNAIRDVIMSETCVYLYINIHIHIYGCIRIL